MVCTIHSPNPTLYLPFSSILLDSYSQSVVLTQCSQNAKFSNFLCDNLGDLISLIAAQSRVMTPEMTTFNGSDVYGKQFRHFFGRLMSRSPVCRICAHYTRPMENEVELLNSFQ